MHRQGSLLDVMHLLSFGNVQFPLVKLNKKNLCNIWQLARWNTREMPIPPYMAWVTVSWCQYLPRWRVSVVEMKLQIACQKPFYDFLCASRGEYSSYYATWFGCLWLSPLHSKFCHAYHNFANTPVLGRWATCWIDDCIKVKVNLSLMHLPFDLWGVF